MGIILFFLGVVCGVFLSGVFRLFSRPAVLPRDNRKGHRRTTGIFSEDSRLKAAFSAPLDSAHPDTTTIPASSQRPKVSENQKKQADRLASALEEAKITPASAEEARLLAHLMKD